VLRDFYDDLTHEYLYWVDDPFLPPHPHEPLPFAGATMSAPRSPVQTAPRRERLRAVLRRATLLLLPIAVAWSLFAAVVAASRFFGLR
jgi:hypothetical protein